MERAPAGGALAALRVRDFRRFWFAALASNTGGWMQAATIPYVVHRISGSTGEVGLTGFLQYLPIMLLGLVGGSLADRFPRRRVLAITQVLQAFLALALWQVVRSGTATVPQIAGLAFAAGLAAGVNVPVWQSFVSQLVPRELLLNAVTLNSTQFNAARAVGPFLAGVLIAVAGPASAFLFNALSYVGVLVALALIRTPGPPRPSVVPGLFQGVGDALRYLRGEPTIVTCCLAIIAISGLGSPLFTYLPVYGAEEFSVTGWRLGLLLGAGGLGSILFAPAILAMAPRVARSRLLVVAMLVYGASVVLTGLLTNYVPTILVLLAFGGSYLAIASTMNTTIQLVVREELRGKVIAVYLACLTGALPLGLTVWGWVAEWVGLRATTVGAGVLLVVVTAVPAATGRFASLARVDVTGGSSAA